MTTSERTHAHTAPSGRFTQGCSTHLGSHDHPAELPKAPTSTSTQPELYRHTQEPLADTGIQSVPSRPHIMASHVDTRCHSLTYAGVRAHTHYSHTHKLSHTCSFRTVMASHMDTITHSEQSIFHTDTIIPPKTQSSPFTLSLLHPYTQQWKIHRYLFRTVTLCWDNGLSKLCLGGGG